MLHRFDERVLPETEHSITSRRSLNRVPRVSSFHCVQKAANKNRGFETVDAKDDSNRAQSWRCCITDTGIVRMTRKKGLSIHLKITTTIAELCRREEPYACQNKEANEQKQFLGRVYSASLPRLSECA